MMEGPLSKWTNVMQGWQYRWFVLNEENGTLSYYTSRDKMMKGQKRGCVRLLGAVMGIDDENDSLFTVTVDNKIFHFQARDEQERDRWIRALEITIHRHSGYYRPRPSKLVPGAPVSLADFDHKIAEADQYLQLMIEQINSIGKKAESADTTEKRDQLRAVLESANAMLETVKHGVVLLQMAKSQITSSQSSGRSIRAYSGGSQASAAQSETDGITLQVTAAAGDRSAGESASSEEDTSDNGMRDNIVPPTSYSSSDEEEYFEVAEEPNGDGDGSPFNEQAKRFGQATMEEDSSFAAHRRPSSSDSASSRTVRRVSTDAGTGANPQPSYDDDGEDFDAICDDTAETDVGNVQEEHGSVLMHLLSQVSIGMDLTKVTLPTFILERRSLLEMYADFFAHPDDFIATTELKTPEERMISVVRYYLSAFYAARKSGVAKKPYNPILGETFRCRWDVPGLSPTGQQIADGPFPGADMNQLTFVAEQVSHHPPISAFYAEHPGRKISFGAHIWTKSSFLGLSIGVHNIGQGCVKLHEHGEEYIMTFPSGYGRSIMTTPWIELGGKVKVNCPQTGYYADVDFLTKGFFGGKAHRIAAEIFRPGFKKPILSIKGEWNGVLTAKSLSGEEKVFIDVTSKPEVKKQCHLIAEQGDRESRRLWRHVTVALKRGRINMATAAKRWIEQRQRDEAKQRQQTNKHWETACFEQIGENWVYNNPLHARKSPE